MRHTHRQGEGLRREESKGLLADEECSPCEFPFFDSVDSCEDVVTSSGCVILGVSSLLEGVKKIQEYEQQLVGPQRLQKHAC